MCQHLQHEHKIIHIKIDSHGTYNFRDSMKLQVSRLHLMWLKVHTNHYTTHWLMLHAEISEENAIEITLKCTTFCIMASQFSNEQ